MQSEREKRLDAIIRDNCGQCLWQMVQEDRRFLVEAHLIQTELHPRIIIVSKAFAKPIPKYTGEWPTMTSFGVYAAVDPWGETFDDLEKRLQEIKAERAPMTA